MIYQGKTNGITSASKAIQSAQPIKDIYGSLNTMRNSQDATSRLGGIMQLGKAFMAIMG